MVPYDITAIRDRYAENFEKASRDSRERWNGGSSGFSTVESQTAIMTGSTAQYMGYQTAMLQRMMETLDNISYSIEKMANHQCLVNALQVAHGQWEFNTDRLGENGEGLNQVKDLLEAYAQALGGYSDANGLEN